jgi:hypothetical protein
MIPIRSIIVPTLIAVSVASTVSAAVATGEPNRLSYFTKEGYGVDVFECDQELVELVERQTKRPGQTYRICFKPNQAAVDANVGIARINDWIWDTTYDGGIAELYAVKDGKGDGVLTDIRCKEDGSICRLDSMLPSKFHLNPGTVAGEGKAIMTSGGAVLMHRDLFVGDFKFTMPEMPEDRIKEYQAMYEAAKQAEAAEAEQSKAEENHAKAAAEANARTSSDDSKSDPSNEEL